MEVWKEIALDGERGAQRLVAEFGDRLLNAAVQITQNYADAEDLVFRTFTQVIKKISQYDGRSAFFTWIYRILVNFRRMDLRKKGVNTLVYMDELPETEDLAPDPAEVFALLSSAEEVRLAVGRLAEPLREVIVFRYFEDMDVSEIARVLSIPVGTVKYRLFEARRQLARSLTQTRISHLSGRGQDEEDGQIRYVHS